MSSDKIATYSCLLLPFWVTYCYGFSVRDFRRFDPPALTRGAGSGVGGVAVRQGVISERRPGSQVGTVLWHTSWGGVGGGAVSLAKCVILAIGGSQRVVKILKNAPFSR